MAVSKLPSGRFQADYYEKIPGTKKYKRKKKSFATKTEAVIWENKNRQREQRKKKTEERDALRANDPEYRDINDVIGYFINSPKYQRLRESTKRRNGYLINHFRDWCALNNHVQIDFFTTETAAEYEKWVYAHYKGKGINHCIGIARAIFESEKKRHGSVVTENPFIHIERLKIDRSEPRFFSTEELRMIFSVCNEFQRNAFGFLLYTGLRTAEALTLPPGRVTASGVEIAPVGTWKPKSFKATRVVPLGGNGRRYADYFLRLNAGKRLLLTGDEAVHEKYLWKRFQGVKDRVKKKYGHDLTGTNIHTFRKTYGSLLVQKGAKMLEVSNLLGHESILTTERIYARLIPDNLQSAVLRMDSLEF